MRREPDPDKAEFPPGLQDQPGTREDQAHLRELQKARQARVVKVVVALAIIVILIIFVVANSKPVPVSFVFVKRTPKLIWVMLGCAILGGIAGYLIGRPGKQMRLRHPKHDDDRKS
jgi:uncharacterized integral membrane protein